MKRPLSNKIDEVKIKYPLGCQVIREKNFLTWM